MLTVWSYTQYFLYSFVSNSIFYRVHPMVLRIIPSCFHLSHFYGAEYLDPIKWALLSLENLSVLLWCFCPLYLSYGDTEERGSGPSPRNVTKMLKFPKLNITFRLLLILSLISYPTWIFVFYQNVHPLFGPWHTKILNFK